MAFIRTISITLIVVYSYHRPWHAKGLGSQEVKIVKVVHI